MVKYGMYGMVPYGVIWYCMIKRTSLDILCYSMERKILKLVPPYTIYSLATPTAMGLLKAYSENPSLQIILLKQADVGSLTVETCITLRESPNK